MSFKDQVINLIIQGKDLFSSEAKKSEQALQELGRESEKLNEQLDELKQQQEAIKAIDSLSAAIKKGERNYVDNAQALDKLKQEQKQATAEAKKLEQAQKEAATSTSKLETQYSQTVAELSQYDAQLATARAEVERLTATQDKGAQASKEQAQALSKAKDDLQLLETAQTNTANSASKLATELDQECIGLDKLGDEVEKASRSKAEYALKVKGARTELNQLGSSLGRNKAELDKQQTVLNKAGIDMNKLADASKDLKTQQAAAEIALKGVNDKLARHNKLLDESKKSSSDFGGSIKAATGSIIAMAGAYVGVDRLWESLKSILTAGDKAKAFSAQMTAMMGSIAAGEQATAWIKDFANRTGTELEGAKLAFAKLKTFGIDPMNGALQSMVDYNAKLGGSQEDLEGIILAVGQAWAKQKFQGEEILQLVERGVPVWDLLQKVTGKNTLELSKLSEAGKLGRDVMQQLFDEMGKQANGQAALSLERLGGQINLISNKWTEFKQIIADSGAYQVAVDLLKDLNTKFDELNKNGKIKQAAQDISDFFSSILKDGGESLKGMLENITAFATGLNVVAGSIRLVFNGITAGFSLIGAASAGLLSLFPQLMAKILSVFGDNKLSNFFQSVADGFLSISKGLINQVEQDSKDVAASLKQMGFDIRQDSDKTAETQVKNSNIIQSAILEQMSLQATAREVEKQAAELENERAKKEIELWLSRKTAAEDHFNAVRNAGKSSAEDVATAQKLLVDTLKGLSDAQSAQEKTTTGLADANTKLGFATQVLKEEQNQLAQEALTKVREAFITGKASAEQYKNAQDDASKATQELSKAQADALLTADELAKKQAEDSVKVKESIKTELDLKRELQQQNVNDAQADVERTAALVLTWEERTKAAKKHYSDLQSVGTTTVAELDAAQIALENSTLRLGQVQDELKQKQDGLATSTENLKNITINGLIEQRETAERELAGVRVAFSRGQASVEDYKSAQVKLEKATDAVKEAQKGQKVTTKDLELAHTAATRKTVEGLKAQEKAAKETFETMVQKAKDGEASTEDLNKAFLEYAKVAIQAAAASDEQVDASIRQQAAALGLGKDLDTLIEQYKRLKDAQSGLGDNTQQTADNVKKGSTEIGTTISNTMDTVVKSAEQAGVGLQSIAQYFADIGTAVYDNVKALSDGAARYFNTIVYGVQNVKKEFGDLGQVENEIERLTGVIYELDNTLAKTVDFVGLRTWALETEKAGKVAERAYYRQKLELLNLVDALDNTDKANLSIINSATRATKALDLVNDQDMSLLTSALDSAKQRMDSLRDSAESTLKSLQDELDGYLGRQDEIEKRRYQEQVADLKEQLAAAERTGDKQLIADLHEAERTLKQVYEFRTAEIKTQQAADKQSAAEAKKQAEASAATAKAAAQTQATATVNTQANTQTSTQSVANTSDMQVLQLQVGNSTFNAQMKRSLVTELMNEIKRLQSVGG
ncbi:tape measure protein [Shewanella sp. 1180_01]|uniref:tape measure protein n=1 Tax=Shewanella sp. 1180_01 TaxID=2604451 RepID=UPI004063F9F5